MPMVQLTIKAIKAIDHGRQVHLASRDLELSDVGKPFLIQGSSLEVAIDEVHWCWTDFAQLGVIPTTSVGGDDQTFLVHQTECCLFSCWYRAIAVKCPGPNF